MKMSKQHDKVVAEKFLKSMMHHGWYIHASLVHLSLADPLVSDDVKREI